MRRATRALPLFACAALLPACSPSGEASQGAPDAIEGRVSSGEGEPEAGVWVIAETEALPTTYRKIVVTDEEGRFVLPELPEAEYRVWVRGYGLADSSATRAEPGDALALEATPAAGPEEAARVYPASYWLSLLEPPGRSAAWSSSFKLNCELCHQLGSPVTRARSREGYALGLEKARFMHQTASWLGRERLLDALEGWSERIRAGATPPAPPRPQGAERNVVITQWEWGDAFTYAHDEIATDRRDPTVNASGPVYGVDLGNDRLLVLDPEAHTARSHEVPTRGGFDTPWCEQSYRPLGGERARPIGLGSLGCPVREGITSYEGAYDNPANPHNPMMDARGRVWITTQIRREWGEDLPDFCRDDAAVAEHYHHRQLAYYDPERGEFELVDTCFGTHHLQFDREGVLWTSGDVHLFGWLDPARYDPDEPETLEAAQGWARMRVDRDGDGEAETPISGFNYGVIPNPADGSVWTAQPGAELGGPIDDRGRLVRYDPAAEAFEAYTPPEPGAGPRGVDVDSEGTIWTSLGGSGHLARFDRSKCERTWGAGEQCAEGWTLYRSPGPTLDTAGEPERRHGADFHYYLWVDRHDALGMGEGTVILNGTGSDSLLAFDPEAEAFTVIRIPYPMNTFTRGLDGRIDDPDAGWKGRGLWFTNGLDPVLHSEVPRSYVGHVQMRPHPLAR